MTNINSLQYAIFADRYALKTPLNEARSGDTAILKENGVVQFFTFEAWNKNKNNVSLKDKEGNTRIIDLANQKLTILAETTYEELWNRLATTIGQNKKEVSIYKELLTDWKFVPGGRILSGVGIKGNRTPYNCYVIQYPHDSRGGIIETLKDMTEIMARGGGVGINISSLRPENAEVKGVNGRSSGPVNWASIYSFSTNLIEQGGSRRGALMLMMEDWHPDILTFINAKRTPGVLEHANISVCVSDAFMKAVKEDKNWTLVFPETEHPAYDQEWDGDIKKWVKKKYPIIKYRTIKAKHIWKSIIESAWESAEPGVWFIDRANQNNNSIHRLIATNPCGEQALPPNGVCNLGAINLAHPHMTLNGRLNLPELERITRAAIHFLDRVIDYDTSQYNKEERRIGLGVMGLAELFIRLKVKYGSEESIELTKEVFKTIRNVSYQTSSNLARTKGTNQALSPSLLTNPIIMDLPEEIYQDIVDHGLRNVTLNTVAPTGSTGTMINTSTGIEPFYLWTFTRKSNLGDYKQTVPIVEEWLEKNPNKTISDLPDYFVTSMQISPEDHVAVQAAAQKYIDSSVSKTCNLPQSASVQDVETIFNLMYDLGCKGGTIYRDNSRQTQILNSIEEKDKAPFRERRNPLIGYTFKQVSPVGTVYITITEDEEGAFETFITVGKSGSEITAIAEAIGRLISLNLRSTKNDPNKTLLDLIDQLKNIGGGNTIGFGQNKVSSLPDAVSRALTEYMDLKDSGVKTDSSALTDICPDCGNSAFIRIDGCQKCLACGYSVC